jgi:hypothetical protein
MTSKLGPILIALAIVFAVATTFSPAAAAPVQYPPATTASTPTTQGTGVLGTQVGQGTGASGVTGTTGEAAGTGLARTGANLEPFALVGLVLILVGAFAMATSPVLRRRSHDG